MTARSKVLLIEDNPERGRQIEAALKAALKPSVIVERFDISTKVVKGAYEDRLMLTLKKREYSNLGLIVTDRDLSASTSYPGLSEAPISKVARQLSVPVCIYAAGKYDSFLERHRSGGGGRIILSSADLGAMARTVRVLADGFDRLRVLVEAISRSKRKRQKYQGPATVLAELLDAREVVDQLALYSRGDQRMIDGLTPSRPTQIVPGGLQTDVRSVALALGVWLYDSILRFPGVVLDRASGASFLGVEGKSLEKSDVMRAFEEAQYRGPFADPEEPRWWRHRLVELLKSKGAADGRAFIKKVTGKMPHPCVCSVDGKAPAGFLCVMTCKPVCEEHSVGQVGWLPRGADLARVTKDIYEKIGPWIGMS